MKGIWDEFFQYLRPGAKASTYRLFLRSMILYLAVKKPAQNFPLLHPKTWSFYFLIYANYSFPISTAYNLIKVPVWNT